MSIPSIATIRSSPKEIKATESYRMTMNLVSVTHTETEETTGKIEIKVPYDGNIHVNNQSTRDLSAQWRYGRLPTHSRALIGYLNLNNHAKTDLDVQYGLSLRNDVIPLDIGVKERGLRYLESLVEDKFEQYSEIKYTPDALPFSPISLKFFITDEILADQFTRAIMPKFNRHMTLGFDIVLSLSPTQMKTFADQTVELFDFRMDWISIPTTEQISASIKKLNSAGKNDLEDTAVFYDAESQQVVCPKIKLIKDAEKNQYSTTLTLQLPEPMDVYQEKIFTGTVQMRYPFLLSGLNLNYYKTNGEADDLKIKTETKLFIKFRINILKQFQNKQHVPSQLFQFPRVILNEDRIEDIKAILSEEQFKIIYQKPPYSHFKNRVELRAVRQEGVGVLKLRLLLNGQPTITERERAIPGDEKFVTLFPSGGFICRIQASLPKDNRSVVNLIHKLHTIMKERFQNVSILD